MSTEFNHRLCSSPHQIMGNFGIHNIELSDEYCENFGFRADTQALSDSGLERIFDYASRLYNDRNRYFSE